MKNQKGLPAQAGFLQILIVLAVAAALVVIGFGIFSKKSNGPAPVANATLPPLLQTQYNEGTREAPVIKTRSDLDVAVSSLDQTDTAEIDAGMKSLNSTSLDF